VRTRRASKPERAEPDRNGTHRTVPSRDLATSGKWVDLDVLVAWSPSASSFPTHASSLRMLSYLFLFTCHCLPVCLLRCRGDTTLYAKSAQVAVSRPLHALMPNMNSRFFFSRRQIML